MAYMLCPLSSDQMHVLYQWKINETNWDLYTCRPVGELPAEPEFVENLKKKIAQEILQVYVVTARHVIRHVKKK